MTTITTPGVYDGIPDADYHADIHVPGGSLSSTGARAILRSPAHYRWALDHRVQKATFDVGHAVHSVVLGVGMKVDVVDAPDWRSKAAQAARDESYASGRTPLLAGAYTEVTAMAASVLAHPVARRALETPGKREQSVYAPDPQTGVWLRARFDHLPDVCNADSPAVDLKTSVSADPNAFGRSAADYGYDVQSEWYQHVLRLARGDEATAFVFVVVEKSEPYLVSVVELDAEFAAIGRARMRRAIDTYAHCRAADDWPGYEPITHLAGPPRWLAYQEEMVI